jgi:AcrR family transcriptional regulator
MDQPSNRQLTKADWTKVAMAAFKSDGVDAVRVLPLAVALGVSRGSFYWHFKDRDALLLEVLTQWSGTQTDAIIAVVETGGGPSSNKLLRLLETCAKDDGHLEMALRSWAQTDATARQFVENVDDKRVAYLAALIAEAGKTHVGAETKARVAYSSWLGEYAAGSNEATRVANMVCLHQMLLGG